MCLRSYWTSCTMSSPESKPSDCRLRCCRACYRRLRGQTAIRIHAWQTRWCFRAQSKQSGQAKCLPAFVCTQASFRPVCVAKQNARMDIQVHICTYIDIPIYMYIYVHICNICKYTCIYRCICMHMYIYLYIQRHIRVHTCT